MTFARVNYQLAALAIAWLHLAQAPHARAVTVDEMVRETIGAPVYASDGHEVGEVADVSMSDDGEIDAIRIRIGAFLGFGDHVVALSKGDFTVLRGAVVVDLPAEAIETLRPVPADG